MSYHDQDTPILVIASRVTALMGVVRTSYKCAPCDLQAASLATPAPTPRLAPSALHLHLHVHLLLLPLQKPPE